MQRLIMATGVVCASLASYSLPTDATPAERGEKALLGRHFTPPTFSTSAYQNAWRFWEPPLKGKPANYDEAFRQYYGMHAAPYPNDGYPMGLREAPNFLGRKALATDCLLCHAGSIMGQSYIGLPNSTLDMEAMWSDLAAADGMPRRTPFHFTNVRGTTEAGGMAVFLLEVREPDLKLRTSRLNLGLKDDLCEDPPAWWLLQKKKTMYHTGGSDARSVRSIMQFMMSPLNGAGTFDKEEPTFRDIQAYLLSLKPPKYPLPIDETLAKKGEELFNKTCARCHGAYGPNPIYPNKNVPLEDIGTDATRFRGISKEFGLYYNKSWFAHEQSGWLADEFPARPTLGYQAPPLDGVWATAPYFHNGSVPTVADVLNSKARPKIYTRSFRTDKDAYDAVRLGWKVQVLDRGPDASLPTIERRKVYDTTQPGRGNGGHTFGDHFTDDERKAVIEYLKTL